MDSPYRLAPIQVLVPEVEVPAEYIVPEEENEPPAEENHVVVPAVIDG